MSTIVSTPRAAPIVDAPVLGPAPAGPTHLVTAADQAAADPLAPTGRNGWSPADIRVTHARDNGFVATGIAFLMGGRHEEPGQRLSTKQVDTLAPYYAAEFGLDEGYVRRELAKVYVYIGGPSIRGNALTVGHHIYVPDEESLRSILSPTNKRWLTHELTHTLQTLAYDSGDRHGFLAQYGIGSVLGHDPTQPGTGTGPYVWGAAFTGSVLADKPATELGAPAATTRDRLWMSVIPAAAVATPVALGAAALLAGTRAGTGIAFMAGTHAPTAAGAAVLGPALLGSVIGGWGGQAGLDPTGSTIAGGVGGGLLAAASLIRGGAWGGTPVQRAVSVGLTLTGGAVGAATAHIGRATVDGSSTGARELVARGASHGPNLPPSAPLGFGLALHDSHWREIDAELSAQRFLAPYPAAPKPASPVHGRDPDSEPALGRPGQVRHWLAERASWGIGLPLLAGGVLAPVVGVGVHAARAVRAGHLSGIGFARSAGYATALTVAPMLAGALAAPFFEDVTGAPMVGRISGALAGGAATAGALALVHGWSGSSRVELAAMAAATLVGAGAGLATGGLSTGALHARQREYVLPGAAPAPAASAH